MATKQWSNGDIVTLTPVAGGLQVSSDPNLTGAPRQMQVTIQTTNPGEKASCVLTIIQGIMMAKLYATGGNQYGQLGLGDTNNRQTFTLVGNDANWDKVSVGNYHVLAIKNGELWAWGRNNYGQLGLGNTINYNSPIKVGTLSNWTAVSAKVATSLGIESGNLYAWGDNGKSQCGSFFVFDNRFTSPRKYGTDTGWERVAAGSGFSMAIKSGELYTCGDNQYGQLGLGNTNDKSSFTRVGTYDDWEEISGLFQAFGIRSGMLFGWGYNYNYELGLGDTNNKTSPVQIGTDTGWEKVDAGNGFSMAIKSGMLFGWGLNNNRQLGLTDNTTKTTPTQVGADSDWEEIKCSSEQYYRFSIAIKGS